MASTGDMPGAFSPKYAVAPTLDFTGARPQLFHLHSTPSVTDPLQRTISPDPSDQFVGCGSRKRAKYEYSNELSTPRWSSSVQSSDFLSGPPLSPAPLVGTSYYLASGTDTPAATPIEHEQDYRTNRIRQIQTQSADSYFPETSLCLTREGNGGKRVGISPGDKEGWGKTFSSVVGGVAGIINFCWSSAFQGFHAGGGRGYGTARQQWLEKDDMFANECQASTPIPGGFPDVDYIPDYMSHPTPNDTPSIRDNGDGSNGSWVVVQNDSLGSREASPTRAARKLPRSSTHCSAWRPLSSRVTPRPKLAPSRPSLTSHAGSPVQQHTASFASPRGSPNATSPQRPSTANPRAYNASPGSPDVQRFAAKARKKEKDEAASMRRLNSQLKAMIKEGKEALGTKVEVLGDCTVLEDEGYAEGNF